MPQSAILTEPAVTLNGDLKELDRLAPWLAHFCREAGLDDDLEFRLNLALEELFANQLSRRMPRAAGRRIDSVAIRGFRDSG